ncbi:MAG: YbgC/FadM family acyl-CoA thioesterase [Nitrospirae bacterium]|nr:YbgC/FadM family acyl-CoA thioesterase [Nitrospirota bacterium]
MSHVHKVRVYYEDTDCGGVVYYANYLRYFERARTGFLESKGADLKALMAEGTYFVVSEVNVKYLSPARYGDILIVGTRVEKSGPASISFGHRVTREGTDEVIAEASVRLGCVGRDMKPQRMKDVIRKAVSSE